jgi:hypothetical protein
MVRHRTQWVPRRGPHPASDTEWRYSSREFPDADVTLAVALRLDTRLLVRENDELDARHLDSVGTLMPSLCEASVKLPPQSAITFNARARIVSSTLCRHGPRSRFVMVCVAYRDGAVSI